MWASECDVPDRRSVLFRRVRTSGITFSNVMLTSTAPAGVPSDDLDRPPPKDLASDPHVVPPLTFVSAAGQFFDALSAPAGSTFSSTGAAAAAEGKDPSAPGTAYGPASAGETWPPAPAPPGGGLATRDASAPDPVLPLLILLNGTVSLGQAALGPAQRPVTRSAVVTCMRRADGDGPLCPDAVLDMGQMLGGLLLLGNETRVFFEGVTLRNISDAFVPSILRPGTGAAGGMLLGLFEHDRWGGWRPVGRGASAVSGLLAGWLAGW